MAENKLFQKVFVSIMLVAAIIIGVILIYQLLRYILGGSWSAEDLLVTIVVLNTSGLITASYIMGKMQAKQHYELRMLRQEMQNAVRNIQQDVEAIKAKVL